MELKVKAQEAIDQMVMELRVVNSSHNTIDAYNGNMRTFVRNYNS